MNMRNSSYSAAVSASSWGCELKYRYNYELDDVADVSLFVRLWVEMPRVGSSNGFHRRQPLREAVSWNDYDIEGNSVKLRQPLREAVSWNITALYKNRGFLCQPLREAVSWNVRISVIVLIVSGQPLREAVSWNDEVEKAVQEVSGQPLREAVSWNTVGKPKKSDNQMSASSWGCELKCF